MRQTDDAYLVGAATNELGRIIELALDFLGEGSYEAKIMEDGDNGHYLTNRETLKVTEKQVDKHDVLKLTLVPGGGACLIFMKK
ncbi:glycoside hydrolase family 97 C-terminal domain-containing protein [Parabacteroides sp. AM58-2XD]|nr:glycoside hydrolase family 97 C-terminal domain-containing protein [Parabacteroides sp. AM58-2XD]